MRSSLFALTIVAAFAIAPVALAQDDDPAGWSDAAARSAFELCRYDAPDAAKVAEHGEVAGWPKFTPYLEHPFGFKRESGGESRRILTIGDKTTFVEVTVQSGEVTSAQPASISYFRCNVAANQPVNASLETYFTALYGKPVVKTDAAIVWLTGAGADAAGDDGAAIKPVADGAAGAKVMRIELTRERGLDRAKLSIFQKVG